MGAEGIWVLSTFLLNFAVNLNLLKKSYAILVLLVLGFMADLQSYSDVSEIVPGAIYKVIVYDVIIISCTCKNHHHFSSVNIKVKQVSAINRMSIPGIELCMCMIR